LKHFRNESSATSPGSAQRILCAIAAFIAILGLADSIYLTVEHLTGETVTCIASIGCQDVLGSAYATVGKVPLAAIGALGYFIAFSAATLAAFGSAHAKTFLVLVVGVMLAVTLWLLYLQAFVLHAFCDYCLLSAAFVSILSGIVVILFWRRASS
jgi:uncharacterized membrane protein